MVSETPTPLPARVRSSSTTPSPSLSATPVPTKARRLLAPKVSTDIFSLLAAPTVLTNSSLRCRATLPLTKTKFSIDTSTEPVTLKSVALSSRDSLPSARLKPSP